MADRIEDINWFGIQSADEAIEAVDMMRKQLILMGKELKKLLIGFGESMAQRAWTKTRNTVISLLDTFRVDSLQSYSNAVALFGEDLVGTLYGVSAGFEGLKLAVIQGITPLVQIVAPVVRVLTYLLTELVKLLGGLIRFLLTGSAEAQEFSGAVTGANSSVKGLKRSLAGFDEINRLGDATGTAAIAADLSQLKPLSAGWTAIAAKLEKLLAPLRELDLTPAAESLEKLTQALKPITRGLFEGLEWAWYNLFVPLAQWAVEELLPAFLDMLTDALGALGTVVEELKPYFSWLWEECLKPLAQWKGDQIVAYLQGVCDELGGLSGWIGINQDPVDRFITSGKLLITALGELAQNTMSFSDASDGASDSVSGFLSYLLNAFTPFQSSVGLFGDIALSVGQLATAFDIVSDASGSAWSVMSSVWENAWYNLKQKFTDPAYSGIRQCINNIIGLLNTMLSATTTGVNHMGEAMNSLSFTVPSWVPLIGGKTFSFSIRPLQAPWIPYLAKGAVLPANKPFMAVVGDQRHGTNVEAPLSVIQEAVAAVMEDYSAANLAGHEATVGVLQQILEAVLGVQIGDDVIAGAVARYDRKMAIVRGGYL